MDRTKSGSDTVHEYWTKQCACVDTSSGPRIVVRTTVLDCDLDQIKVGAMLVRFACDGCDEPWVRHGNADEYFDLGAVVDGE
jgi:hypothetical protein